MVVPQVRITNAAQSHNRQLRLRGFGRRRDESHRLGHRRDTGEALGKQAGGMGLKGAASFQWGDAQNAMDYWAQKIPKPMLELQSNSTAKS